MTRAAPAARMQLELRGAGVCDDLSPRGSSTQSRSRKLWSSDALAQCRDRRLFDARDPSTAVHRQVLPWKSRVSSAAHGVRLATIAIPQPL